MWGHIPRGLAMKMHPQTNIVPQLFEELKPYSFSSVQINKDFAFGVGHAVRITFELPNESDEYGPDKDGAKDFAMLAIPVFDNHHVKTLDDLGERIRSIKSSDVTIVNDFDVPWVTQTKVHFPKVGKKKVKKVNAGGDDSEEEEDEEDEDEDEQEEEDEEEDEEEEEDEDKASASGSGSDGSGAKDEDGSDDEEGSDSAAKPKKAKSAKGKG